MHSKRCDSFLGTGSVQPKQSILRENDKYIKCRGHSELFKYTKRGGKKGGQKSLEANQLTRSARKIEKNHNFIFEGVNMKGGIKRGTTFQHVSSDHLYHDRRL